MKITLTAALATMLMLSSSVTAAAGKYDGTSWSSASRNVTTMDYDADRCEVCRAENGRATMSECGSPEEMQSNVPYVIYCGDNVWGHAGSARGTRMVGSGESVGSFQAQSDDYWTIK